MVYSFVLKKKTFERRFSLDNNYSHGACMFFLSPYNGDVGSYSPTVFSFLWAKNKFK